MDEPDVRQRIEAELKKRDKSIRNKNAIEKFLGLFPGANALYGVLVGSQDAIELERQRLTLNQLLDLVTAIDDKLRGKNIDYLEAGLQVLIKNVTADGDIAGIEGDTSHAAMKEIFEKPVSVQITDSVAKSDITGIKLNVDKELPIKNQVQVNMDFGQVQLNPQLGEITLGKGITNKD